MDRHGTLCSEDLENGQTFKKQFTLEHSQYPSLHGVQKLVILMERNLVYIVVV